VGLRFCNPLIVSEVAGLPIPNLSPRRKPMKRKLTLVLGMVLILVSTAYAYDVTYTYTPVNYPGAEWTVAYGINNAGVIVGEYGTEWMGPSHGFSLADGVYTPIDYPGSLETLALAINNKGVIIGTYRDGNAWYGYSLDGGVFTTLDYIGYGINDAGTIVSSSAICSLSADLCASWNYPGEPLGINNAGAIVGANENEGFSLIDGTYTLLDYSAGITPAPMIWWTQARGINNAGTIVGWADDTLYGHHGFSMYKGIYTRVVYPPMYWTVALGINDVGAIVGWAGSDIVPWGFVATPDATVVGIDVEPFIKANIIPLTMRGLIPVAILSSSTFSTTTVKPESVIFAGASAQKFKISLDVNGDRKADLILFFKAQDLRLTCSSTEAALTGLTKDGQYIKGIDKVKIVSLRGLCH
jgi:hypothetical protein